MIKKIVCKIKGHSFIMAGSCPFTRNNYIVCQNCLLMKVDNEKMD